MARLLRTLFAATALLALPLLAGCASSVLDPAGDIARQQRDIILISTGLMLLIIVPVMILIVLFAWRYRKGGGATYDPDFDHSTALELVIWSAPLLIIICLGALTWSSTHLLDPFRPLDRIAPGRPADRKLAPLRVQVVSLDWKWLFIYPDQGIATINELVLPVDREVRFDLTSTNMMNTFYAPTLAGMIYTMPGMKSTLHAVLNRPGAYRGMSANYSGAGFSRMQFALRGVDEAAFARWVAGVKAMPRVLDTRAFIALERPSERVPAIHFARVEGDLFDRVFNRCVRPGTPCMSEVMAHDMRGGEGHRAMPPGHGTAPPHGQKPEGAIFKDSQEQRGTGQSRDKQTDPRRAPGSTKPGDPRNRSLSFLIDRPGARAGTEQL